MLESIRYLAIEGVIGAGKTTLVEIISSMFAAGKMLEKFEDNPFLADFYKDKNQFGFQTQLWFLLSRYRQIREELAQENLFHKTVISDFMFAKDKIFAFLNLDENERTLYSRIAEALEKDIAKPDFVVYLQASTDVLMERIALRGRPFERNMDRSYIAELNEAYNHFFFHYQDSPVLIIDTNRVDFTESIDDLDEIVSQIEKYSGRGGTRYLNPLDRKTLKPVRRDSEG